MNIKGSENYKTLSKLAILVSLISSVLFFILTKSANTQSSSIILTLILSFILRIVGIASISFGLIWGIGGVFRHKDYKVVTIFIILFIGLIFLPHKFILKQQKEKDEHAKIEIESMYKEAQIQENFSNKLDRIYKSHYAYYSEVFSKPHEIFPSPYPNVFVLENGLMVYIFSPTITDKSFLNKTVEIKIPSYRFFSDKYKIFEDNLTSIIMDAPEEILQQYEDPTDPFWKNKLRIPVEIFYEGKKIDS